MELGGAFRYSTGFGAIEEGLISTGGTLGCRPPAGPRGRNPSSLRVEPRRAAPRFQALALVPWQGPCGDITINNIFGLIIVMSTFGLDAALILFSYVLILRCVLAIASQEERLKTLNTCVSHLCEQILAI